MRMHSMALGRMPAIHNYVSLKATTHDMSRSGTERRGRDARQPRLVAFRRLILLLHPFLIIVRPLDLR